MTARDLGELLAILKRGRQAEVTATQYYTSETQEVTKALKEIAKSAKPLPTSEGSSGLTERADAARLQLLDDEDPSDIDESEWDTIPWSTSSAYDPNNALEEYRELLGARAPEDLEDLLILFCSSQFVRMNRGPVSMTLNLNYFTWAVLMNAPMVALRRPLAWVEKEVDAIVAVMLRLGA